MTSHSAALLRHFDVKMAVFRIKLVSVWRSEKCEYEYLDDGADFAEDMGDDAVEMAGSGLTESMMLPEALR